MKEELTESLEKYLEAVYHIVKTNKAARVKDVANYLNIGAPSTSDAIKTLAKKKFINYEPYGIITITQKGIEKAENKLERNIVISNFLEKVLNIESDLIEQTAKQFEYSMHEDVIEKFVQFLSFMETCSCKEPKWVKSYHYFAENGAMKDKCISCIKNKEHFDNSSCCGGCCE